MGTVFRVLTQDARLADRVDGLLRDFEATESPARAAHIVHLTGAPEESHALYQGCARLKSQDSGEDLLPTLVSVVNYAVVDRCPYFSAHAAVVAGGKRVVALPADSGQGKSTLAAALVVAGFSYLSDEALVFDDDGRVLPYPKPIALSPWSCEAVGIPSAGIETLVTAKDLGSKSHPGPDELTDVVIARYGHEEPTLEERPRSEAVAELLGKSFNHYKNPERAFRLATGAARRARVWRLDYGDPLQAAELLRESLR